MSRSCTKFLKYISLLLLLTLLFSLIRVRPALAAPCGNGICQESQGETCETCPEDCGACPTPEPEPTPTPGAEPTPTPGGEPTPTPEPGAEPTPAPAPSEEGEAAPAAGAAGG